jgi:chloramphenicol 3-O-phosphotransferase
VLLFTGPTGVGKSAVLSAASSLLSVAGVPHASVTLSDVGRLYPTPADDEWNERIAHRNLQSLWRNYAAEGAERLLLERVLETRSLLSRIVAAVPGADIKVVRLRAPLPLLRERIAARQAEDPAWYLGAAEYLHSVFDTAGVEDFVVDNVDRPVRDVAADVLRLAGWRSAAGSVPEV